MLGEDVEGGFAMPNGWQHCGRNDKLPKIMGLFFMFPLNEIFTYNTGGADIILAITKITRNHRHTDTPVQASRTEG